MSTALHRDDAPSVPLYRDPRVRAVFYQLLVVLFVLLGGWILVSNTMANLARLGVASGFGFLERPSGFDIGQTLIDYTAASTFGRAFLVGFLNTILVAIVGIILATIVGFAMGIARLSHNWLISTLATFYVEIVRNIPLLLQLLLIYAIIIHALPQPRESATLLGAVLLNTGGLFLPKPIPETGFAVWAVVSLLALAVIPIVLRWAARRRETTGQEVHTFWYVMGLLAVVPVAYLVTGMPLQWDLPVMGRFRPSGGLQVNPEFVALVLGLAIYTGAFIAEIVRSGILAVSKGQWEAAGSLGLTRGQTLRFIVIPQALRVIIPPQTNQYLNLTKNSSLAVAIGYPDFFNVAGTINNQTGQAVEVIA
ncbi:MAG: amino acid ABC transporter permease, partial [Geminicoccaceae bacterium]